MELAETMEPSEIKPKRSRKSNKKKIILNEAIVTQRKNENWNQVCRSIQDFIKDKANDFILLYSDKNIFIVGKKVLIKEIIENTNNTFQPLETRIKQNHYKYFLIVNPDTIEASNKGRKLNTLIEQHIFFRSPIYCPDTAKAMLSILSEFR